VDGRNKPGHDELKTKQKFKRQAWQEVQERRWRIIRDWDAALHR
jgi:hypothetical protein